MGFFFAELVLVLFPPICKADINSVCLSVLDLSRSGSNFLLFLEGCAECTKTPTDVLCLVVSLSDYTIC